MNRKDFRPTNNSSSGISDKDRKLIRKNKADKYFLDKKGEHVNYIETKDGRLMKVSGNGEKLVAREEKLKAQDKEMRKARKWDAKHSQEKYLRGSSDKDLQKSEIAQLRKDNYEQAKKNLKNPPKKAWWLPQSEYDRERAMDIEVVRAKGKKAYIETTGKATK
jgi:ATPase subunit of ABC transporter with duplicated ATPase domains